MSVQQARKLASALGFGSESVVKTIDEVLKTYARLTPASPVAQAQNDHGALAGLGDNDHTQYPLASVGIWTPADGSGAGLSLTVNSADYIVHGSLVLARASITYPATADTSDAIISGLPATCGANAKRQGWVSWSDASIGLYARPAGTTIELYVNPGGAAAGNDDLTISTIFLAALFSP